jgi:heme-degrading monooxygenase HmoA
MRAEFSVLYRWRVKPELEQEFIRAWSVATDAFKTVGALGSRLHRTDDGELVAYAEWPSRETWETARGASPVDAQTGAVMREATVSFEMLPLTPVADLLLRR